MQFMEKLGLSDKQKADIAGLRTEMQKSMVGIQAKIKLARIDMRTLAASDNPEKSAIEAKMKEVSDLQFQAKKAVLDHLFSVYALLTPEQKKMFKAHMMAGLAGGMHRMQWRGMGRMGGGRMGSMGGNMMGPMGGSEMGPVDGNEMGPVDGSEMGPMDGNGLDPMQDSEMDLSDGEWN
jgi:Spy/CpxP family protein refolding chaperone